MINLVLVICFYIFLAVQEEAVKIPELPAYTNQGYMINRVLSLNKQIFVHLMILFFIRRYKIVLINYLLDKCSKNIFIITEFGNDNLY